MTHTYKKFIAALTALALTLSLLLPAAAETVAAAETAAAAMYISARLCYNQFSSALRK